MAAVALTDLPPNIIQSICVHCPRGVLFDVATTCRLLSDAALQSLWHTIPCFAVTALTFPRELLRWEVSEPQPREWPFWRAVKTIRTMSFTRTLAPSDLARFHTYAHYVRAVDSRSLRRTTFLLSPFAWLELERVLVPGCLPNLRSLIKYDFETSTVEPMRIFLSHNLRHLEYHFYGLDQEGPARDDPIAEPAAGWVAGLFAGVAHHTSDVRVFHLTVPRSMDPALRASQLFSGAVPKLSSVVSFQIIYNIPTPSGTLSYLASFSQLHSLALGVKSEEFPAGVPELSEGSFPALRTLKIMVDSTVWFVALLSKVRSQQLTTVSLEFNTPAKMDDCHALFTTLAGHPSAEVLESLVIRFRGSVEYTHHTWSPLPLPPPVLIPLCSLHRLQCITIDWGRYYAALDDDTLLQLVRAWPQLRMADLGRPFYTVTSSAPRVTLSGLASVMEHCRNVQTLSIPLEDIRAQEVSALLARRPPRIFEMIPTQAADDSGDGTRLMRPVFCPLMRLNVGPSLIAEADVGGVAAVLSQWFPALRSIDCYCPVRSGNAEGLEQDGIPVDHLHRQRGRWQEVAWMVPAMALARRQEQLWKYL
ncbi:hypothetical protein C8T65DRAFT_231497 [Cerioporus squamosus]|nr:hypothetical protein C8T65DRAFT_231497 [Cerioporus squamosus]